VGRDTGPYDPSDDTATGGWYNPDGLGDKVSDHVDYMPWTFSEVEVNVTSPSGGEIWYDTQDITWTASNSGPLTIKIELYDGSSFTTIADGLSNTGVYSWDTTGVPDGTYKIRVTATTGGDAMGFDLSDGWFVVHNIFSVSISASPASQNTRQNIEAVYTLTVTNEQPVADTFDLSLVNIDNASVAELSQSTIAVGAWSSEAVSLNVTDETEGTYLVKAVAVSQTNVSINDETTTETRVLPAFAISIYSPKTETSIGGELTYDVRLTSYESSTDNFTLDVTGIDGTWFTLDSQCELSAGKSAVLPMEISIPAGAATGDFMVTVQEISSNLGIDREATAPLHVSADPIIFGLTPANNSHTGATDVLFSWQTSVNSTSEVYIRVEGEPDFVLVTGDTGITHSVTVTSLVRNTWYEFYVRSESAYGSADSEIRRIFIDNGITFSQATYNFTIERDYDQKVSILVYNTDDEAHELLVSVSAPSEDLIIGFVGGGSTDETITINPGGWKYVSLVIHAQDSLFEDYNLILELTNLGAEDIHDYADLNIHVHYPHTEFTLTELSVDSSTLAKTIKVTNLGDPLTDLRISADEDLSDWVIFEPEISHGHMVTGQQTQFVVYPVLSQGYSGVDGSIIAEAAGETVILPVSFMLPPGQEVFSGHAAATLTDEPPVIDTDITVDILENEENLLHIRANFNTLGGTAEWYLEITPDVVYEPTAEELLIGTDVYAPVINWIETADMVEFYYEYITTRDISAGGIDLGDMQSTGFGAPANTGSLSGAKKVYGYFKTNKERYDQAKDYYNRGREQAQEFIKDQRFYDRTTRVIPDAEERRRMHRFLTAYNGVKRVYNFFQIGDKIPGPAGSGISQQIDAGFKTMDAGLNLFLKHRAQYEEEMAAWFGDEHRSADWYCTNRPEVSTGFGLPNWIQPGYVSSEGARVEARFTLPWSASTYRPHDVGILLNDVEIASIYDTIPLGYYVYSFDPSLLNYATAGTATNTITLATEHLNGGHYVVSSDFRVIIMLSDIVLHAVASSQEEADQYVTDIVGVKLICPDFALYPEDMSLSNPHPENGEEVCINVKLRNLGSLGAHFLVQAFDNGLEFWDGRVALAHFDSIDMCIPWTATEGNHTLKVQLNSPGILEESDYRNNEVSQNVYVSPADVTPPMIINIRATNVTTDTATISWYTHEVSDSLVRYGTESGNYVWQPEDEVDVKYHNIELDGLTPDTEYYYVVRSVDPRGNATESEEHIFTTQAVPPPTGEVQGKILLQGRSIYAGAVVSFTAGSNYWETVTNDIGNFSLSLPEGTYDVDVTMSGYLTAHVSGFQVIAGQTNLLSDIILLAGDIDGDGVVGVDELVEILNSFGSSEGGGDLNGDGIVDIFDLVLVGMNYEGGG
jgi:uncharacterized membrane protein